MSAFSKSLRNRLPALGLGVMTALGLGLGATVVLAPVAIAQEKSSIEFGKPYNEAAAAIRAQNWSLAKSKLDEAEKFAKTSQERGLIAKNRDYLIMAAGTPAEKIKFFEGEIAKGNNSHFDLLAGLYEKNGQKDKALQMVRQKVDAGKGSAKDAYYVGTRLLAAGDFAGSLKYGNKAVGKGGKGTPEDYYGLVLESLRKSNQNDAYMAKLEEVILVYPKEIYWKVLIANAQKAPKYNGTVKLDLLRTMAAAKIKLEAKDKLDAANSAMIRQLPNEAVQALTPSPSDADANMKKQIDYTLAQAQGKVAADKAGLPAEEKSLLATGTGPQLVKLAERYMSYGDNAKAVELFQKGIAKGGIDPGEADLARLRMGIAQYRAGKKDEARTTWAAVKADNGAAALAKNWILISKV